MNDIIPVTGWPNSTCVFLFKGGQVLELWKVAYKKHKKTYDHSNFKRMLNSFTWSFSLFYKSKDYDDYLHQVHNQIEEDIKKLLIISFALKPEFSLRHIIIKKIKSSAEEAYFVYFDDKFLSYILQCYTLKQYTREWFSYLFSETEENKRMKVKELDDLYKMCVNSVKGDNVENERRIEINEHSGQS